MKSNKSLFNATLFKSNINRFLPFSVLFLIIELMIYPLIIYTTHFRNGNSRIDFDELATMGIASNVFAGIFAGVFAILVFSYLFTSNKCNAIHAFPIGRKALFTTNLLSAYTLLAAPQLIGFGLALPGIAINASATVLKSALLFQLSTIFLFSFIAISIGVLAMMLSGNAFSGAIIYLILNFIYAAFVLLVEWAVSTFGYGISNLSGLDEYDFFLSPAVNLLIKAANSDSSNKFYISKEFYISLLIYFVISFAVCFLAFLLYKLRELEVAGEMVAFEAENPFIRVIVSIIGGAVFSMGVGSVLSTGRFGYAVLYAVFSFIIYFATQMILKKKFNIFSLKLIIRWVVCCALSLGFILGLAAYETSYIPASDKIESAVFNATYSVNADTENTAQIRELHKELIKYSKEGKAPSSDEYEYEAPVDEGYLSITVHYHMKNGKTVEREYLYDIGSSKKIDSLINGIESKNEYENIFDYLDSLDSEYTINSIIINDYTGSDEIVLDSKDFDEFTKLCKEDIDTLTKDYTSTKKAELIKSENDFDICFSGTISDSTALEEIPERSYGNSFIEGFFSYYEAFTNSKKSYELEIHLNAFPKNSKALKFAEEHYKK